MPDLRATRRKIKIALGVLLGLDAVAAGILFSPLVGSADSRRQQMNQLLNELNLKTRQVEPLRNLDKKVGLANRQISDFYKKRFPAQNSAILTEFGKLAAENGVTILQGRYKPADTEAVHLQPLEIDADLSGGYVNLARFINALERDDMVFIINSVTLASEQTGPIKLQMKLEAYLKTGAS